MDWSILLSVIAVNLLLSGDNALAIAMASQGLKPKHQKTILLLGSLGAVLMQILLTYTASILLDIPYLKIVGGVVLTGVAVRLLISDEAALTQPIENLDLLPTILKIMIANTIMSLDNVLAVAAITEGNPLLLGIGLLISFPVIIGGSSIIAGILDRFPFIMWIGALFLGWTSGGIIASDAFIAQYLDLYDVNHADIAALFAIIVVAIGLVLGKNKAAASNGNENKEQGCD
ncbi:YjbE family putative metal transport protein [Sporomusa sp.]|uniref:YjbE family putative metal transport protein n=1 Tax=Sporomusa sp. TaxID=2078658 RepID=UPI002CC36B5B|nr:YjbE family putative metal transport protein [Sporomusa sp.]HWR45546.1 YjbE family putative metal transport protein [Sporomusa sp.]